MPYPPLYKPFKLLSRSIVGKLADLPISSNAITITWALLLVGSGYSLARGARFTALILVLCAIFLDCVDGDLARCRNRGSESGTLLEQIAHWTGNMSVAAGAGASLHFFYPGTNAVILSSALCVSTAVYIAVVRQVRPYTAAGLEARTYKRVLLAVVRVNYLLSPIELPLSVFFLVFGLRPETILVASGLLSLSSALIFIPHFFIILSLDRRKWEIESSEGFPGVCVREADKLLADDFNGTSVTWYAPGPSRLSSQVLSVGAFQPMYHRDENFETIWRELHADLPKVFRTDGQVVALSCSETGAMEAVVSNFVNPGDRVLVLNDGPSGSRWMSVAKSFGAEVVELGIPYGMPVEISALEKLLGGEHSLKAVFATLSEPAHGGVQDIASIGERVRHSGALFVVDVTSGLAADDFRMDDWGVDVAVGASQHGLMAPPGIGLVALSRRMVNDVQSKAGLASNPRFYWDLGAHLGCLDRPRFAVPTQIAGALYLSVRMILSAGLDRVLAHRQEVASGFRRGCTEVLDLPVVAANPSAACTTVKLPKDINARELQLLLRERHLIGMLTGRSPSGEETLSIGHSGWLFRDDIYNAVEALALCLDTLRTGNATPQELETRGSEKVAALPVGFQRVGVARSKLEPPELSN